MRRRVRGRTARRRGSSRGMSAQTQAGAATAPDPRRPAAPAAGLTKRSAPCRPCAALDFDVRRRGGRRARGRQRRRQVHAGQGDRRDRSPTTAGPSSWTGEPVSITAPQDSAALGIATVYQDLALCDNLDVVANLFLGQRVAAAAAMRVLDEIAMEQRVAPSCSIASRSTLPVGAHRGRDAVRRTASDGGHRALAARRSEDRDARRADRGARRVADRAGARSWSSGCRSAGSA